MSYPLLDKNEEVISVTQGSTPPPNSESNGWGTTLYAGWTGLKTGAAYASTVASNYWNKPPEEATLPTNRPTQPPPSPMKEVPVQEEGGTEEPNHVPRTYVSREEVTRQRVTNLNARIAGYVKRVFTFVKEEYSRSVDLREVTQAGIAFLAQVIKIFQKVFPVPDLPVPNLSQQVPTDKSLKNFPRTQKEETIKGSQYWEDKACEVLFGNRRELKSEETELAKSMGGLISMVLEEGRVGTRRIGPLAALLKDTEELSRIESAVIDVLKRATQNMDAEHFGIYKSRVIEKLDGYLRETLPSLENQGNLAPCQVEANLKKKLSATVYLHSILREGKGNIEEAIQTYFHDTLKKRLAVAIPSSEYTYIRPLLASVIADQVKEGVGQLTSKRGIDTLFYKLIKLLERPTSSSKNDSPPQSGKGLKNEEKPFVLRIITTLLTGIFKAEDLAFLANYFQSYVTDYVDTAIGVVIKSDHRGTSLDLGLINALLIEHVKAQKTTLVPLPKKEEATPAAVVKEFFDKKPAMKEGWSYFDSLINGYEGTKKLYNILKDHPWWLQNLILVLVDDALDQFLPLVPLPVNSSEWVE